MLGQFVSDLLSLETTITTALSPTGFATVISQYWLVLLPKPIALHSIYRCTTLNFLILITVQFIKT